jgi:nucleoside-diphosphate-sugar epimerase
MVDGSKFSKMKILILGHEGYIGRGLMDYFAHKYQVIGWDKKEDLFQLSTGFLVREKIDVLVNLSLMADRSSAKYQIDTAGDHVNVEGARHLARILKGTKIKWLQFSTREVLGPVYTKKDVKKTKWGYRPKFLVDEAQPLRPINPYGKSKVMAEIISESHPYSNIIRLTTGYTDHDQPGGWVIQLARAVCNDKQVKLSNGGDQFRDPVHTNDIACLIEKISEKEIYGEVFHAGGGSNNLISLREFVTIIDPQVKIEKTEGGDLGFAFNIEKANKLTGWMPRECIRKKALQLAKIIKKVKTE